MVRWLLRAGVAVFAAGGLADIAAHAGALQVSSTVERGFHLFTFAGMLLTMLVIALEAVASRKSA